MAEHDADAVLERLVAQFASPYDFLRELVQNSMDAGADRVEVSLEPHPGDEGSKLFELSVVDTGVGMDEAILDGAFTRLFSSTKREDRTMAGGFGVGFVSVFAWEPEAVLVQTGRGGEAWELLFHADRSFEKHRLDVPFEGTTITLFKRGEAGDYPAVAEAVRDTLWRWCRYCPLEISFDDLASDEGPELIQDAPQSAEAVLDLETSLGDGSLRLAYAVPGHAVLLRRGLVLAEGTPGSVFPDLQLGPRAESHLQIWLDSAELETTMARDKVVETEGRRALAERVGAALSDLRRRAVDELEALAGVPTRWSALQRDRYALLHAHLRLEVAEVAPGSDKGSKGRPDSARRADTELHEAFHRRPLFRAAEFGERMGSGVGAGAMAYSIADLRAALAGGPLLHVDDASEPDALAELRSGASWPYPVVWGREGDASWLRALADELGVQLRPAKEVAGLAASAVETLELGTTAAGRALAAVTQLVEGWLEANRSELGAVLRPQLRWVAATDGDASDPPAMGWTAGPIVLTSRAGLPRRALGSLLLDRRHATMVEIATLAERRPRAAAVALASVLALMLGLELEPKLLQRAAEDWPVRPEERPA